MSDDRFYDRHHIFYPHSAWKTGWAKELRNYWYCVLMLPRETVHRKIHFEVPFIEREEGLAYKQALDQLTFLDEFGVLHETDDLEARLNLLICLLDNGVSPTAESLKKQLNAIKPRE